MPHTVGRAIPFSNIADDCYTSKRPPIPFYIAQAVPSFVQLHITKAGGYDPPLVVARGQPTCFRAEPFDSLTLACRLAIVSNTSSS